MFVFWLVVFSSFLFARTEDITYRGLGCFKDDRADRALPVLVRNFRPQIKWFEINQIIRACAKAVEKRGFKVFAMQFYGECWSGKNASLTYKKHGQSTDGCDFDNNVGKDWTNYVYQLEEKDDVIQI